MKKLRRKIVAGVSISATVVFLLTIFLIALTMGVRIARRADDITNLIVHNHGEFPEMEELHEMDEQLRDYENRYDEESPYRLRYYSVWLDGTDIVRYDTSHVASIDKEEAQEMGSSALMKHKKTGYIDDYRFRIDESSGMIVFLDRSTEVNALKELTVLMIMIAVAFITMITMVFWFLSKRIVAPFEENSRMQKQFITDASHELKTPLAIISANAEVLAYKDGENEWIKNITTQVERVSELVNELLTLNRLEEIDEVTDIEEVDLSEKVNATADAFEEVFKGKGVDLHREIQPGVMLNGNKSQLERLSSVLIENASKYVTENGKVEITLKQENRHTILTVFNTCEVDHELDYSLLFDRFYRPDASRTSGSGGHGVGLSIAKRIATLHSGTIEAIPGDEGLTFRVALPNKAKRK